MSNASDWEMRAMDAEQRLADVFDFIRREGYRECNIAACNCNSWHGGHAGDRLREISDIVPHNGVVLKDAIEAIIEERDRLRSLAAVRAPGDEGREALAAWMLANSYATGHGDTTQDLIGELGWQHKERQGLLTASLSSAERERDEARSAFDDASKVAAKMSVEMNAAIAERDRARAELEASRARVVSVYGDVALEAERERDAAESALAVALVERDRARAALEFAEAQLKGTNANIAGWLAARDAQMERANLAERQLDESLAGHRQKAEAFDAIRLLAGQGMDDHDLERTAAGYLQRISVIAYRRALSPAPNATEAE